MHCHNLAKKGRITKRRKEKKLYSFIIFLWWFFGQRQSCLANHVNIQAEFIGCCLEVFFHPELKYLFQEDRLVKDRGWEEWARLSQGQLVEECQLSLALDDGFETLLQENKKRIDSKQCLISGKLFIQFYLKGIWDSIFSSWRKIIHISSLRKRWQWGWWGKTTFCRLRAYCLWCEWRMMRGLWRNWIWVTIFDHNGNRECFTGEWSNHSTFGIGNYVVQYCCLDPQ